MERGEVYVHIDLLVNVTCLLKAPIERQFCVVIRTTLNKFVTSSELCT